MLTRFLKTALLAICILMAVLVALYATSKRWPIPQAQRQALAQLRQPQPPLRGTNMFAALWSLSYAMPEAQRENVLAQDLERFNRLPAGAAFQSAAARYPRQPQWPSTAPALCSASAGSCLDLVRQQPHAYADALAAQAPLLARLRALADYGDYRSPFRPDISALLPESPRLTLSMTANALDFVQGRTTQALSGVCADAQVARVLLRSGDNLLMPMIGAAMLRGNAHLFADMLAELPTQHPLPAQCTTAFAPLAVDDIALCNALHGESRLAFSMLQEDALRQDRQLSWQDRFPLRLLDPERTQALLAPTYTWACGAPVRNLLAQDQPVPHTLIPEPQTTLVACIANATGCLLASVSRPDYANYQHKLQDTAAAVRALAAVQWLRDRPADATPLAQRLADLPPALRGQARPLQPGHDGKSLMLRQYAKPIGNAGEERWPLAGSALAAQRAAPSLQ
ncbi:hypothetical protein [Xanthomonas nasturtii]|uniref:Uncharacterized protein n=1 Tax=Xanthomonas nasturtii TaxID=1843581 RepID=A0A3E1KEN4_9XANT|nr:hypothetical protein [Xanthomonas nasturtii]MCL1532350.1 hypothetical protein [Xanthomonas nasturtii]MCL1567131.1 hypothetical protein [Xanthomonas nasturtii]RFF36999.1 hypothetical protein DZD52_19140 [Xanthomonas nasturtii]